MKTPPWQTAVETIARLRELADQITDLHDEASVLTDKLDAWFGARSQELCPDGSPWSEAAPWENGWCDALNDHEEAKAWQAESLAFLRCAYVENRFPATEVCTLTNVVKGKDGCWERYPVA